MNVAKLGRSLRSYAAHHDHGEGWTYARATDIRHIRYEGDWSGRNGLWERVKWTAHMLLSLRKDSMFRPKGLRNWFWSVVATLRVNLATKSHRPDGVVNDGGVIVHWEEDGEYIEWVGPTVGEKIADFLESEPDHPHAIAIATEMLRVRQLGCDRRAATK